MKRLIIAMLCILPGLTACSTPAAQATDSAQAARPNIILIMADDMGFSDIGCYGGEIQTPNLDALAADGLRFTQFYNTGRCCPTRASLLSGLYPHQAGIGHMMEDKKLEGYQGDLSDRCVTIAEAMGLFGYDTYMSGKWHVTKKVKPQGENDKANWPKQRGFDRFFGTIHGAGSFYDPNSLTRDNTLISPQADPEYEPDFYTTPTRSAINAGDSSANMKSHDKPFFLYVAYTAPHWPMHAHAGGHRQIQGRLRQGLGCRSYRAPQETTGHRPAEIRLGDDTAR